MTRAQRLAGSYLTGVGYGVAVVSKIQDLAATLKNNRPYAVVIDRQDHPAAYRARAARLARPGSSRNPRRRSLPRCRREVHLQPVHWGTNAGSVDSDPGSLTRSAAPAASSGKEVKTVLIIDDEPALLELLTKTLLFKGFQVLPAANGRSGIEFATGSHPDVIILDLTMPDCSGHSSR